MLPFSGGPVWRIEKQKRALGKVFLGSILPAQEKGDVVPFFIR